MARAGQGSTSFALLGPGGHAMKMPSEYLPALPAPAANVPRPAPFPLRCLPPAGAEMAEAICATERTPESLAGCCVLGNLSASVGAGLQVRSGPNRVTRGNVFIVASGESGSGKSETYRH